VFKVVPFSLPWYPILEVVVIFHIDIETMNSHMTAERIFEGQIIGDFFDFWLNKGHIKRQLPMPDNPQPKVHTSFVDDWIVKPSASWPLQSQGKLLKNKAFVHTLLAEIGNNIHLDRLSIFRKRPNAMKGRLFGGSKSSDPVKYAKKSPEDQLMTTKEMGTFPAGSPFLTSYLFLTLPFFQL
jgi:chitinase